MTTTATLQAIQQADQDFEWYPTSRRMIEVVAQHIPTRFDSLMDIGAGDGRVLFQVKAHKNGNLHFRFLPEAIKALNVEAGRLLGWLKGPADVVRELGYTPDEAERCFGANLQLGASSVKLLTASEEAA